MLKGTTFCTDTYGGVTRLEKQKSYVSGRHGISSGLTNGELDRTVKGLSYIRFVGRKDLDRKEDAKDPLRQLLKRYPGAIWLGAHTHGSVLTASGEPRKMMHVDDNGTTFVNCAGLAQAHGKFCDPTSRVLCVFEGSNKALVRTFVHANQSRGLKEKGWCSDAENQLILRHPFSKS